MNAQQEKWQIQSQPKGAPESPYLDEELFVKEAEPEWEARLANLIDGHPLLCEFEERLVRAAETPAIETEGLGDAVGTGSFREAKPDNGQDSAAEEAARVGDSGKDVSSQEVVHPFPDQGEEEDLVEFELGTDDTSEVLPIDYYEIEEAYQNQFVASADISHELKKEEGQYRADQSGSEEPSASQGDESPGTWKEPDPKENQECEVNGRTLSTNSKLQSATVDESEVLELLYEYGTDPGTLEELVQRVRYLVAGEGKFLQSGIESYLTNVLEKQYNMKEGKSVYQAMFRPLRCVGTSLNIFSRVSTRILGASTISMNLTYAKAEKPVRFEIPRMAWKGIDGRYIAVDGLPFIRFWNSIYNAPAWKEYKNIRGGICRGAGAAGALHYAGLVHDDKYIMSQEGDNSWPAGLKSGAFLQLWVDSKVYQAVRDGDTKAKLPGVTGHSCIFRDYKEGKGQEVIVVADQISPRHEIQWGNFYGMKFLIGANLKNVKLVSWAS